MAPLHPVAWAMFASGGGLPDKEGKIQPGEWRRSKHLEYLGNLLLKASRREIRRLCVSFPPRHGKSELISKYYASWLLGTNPKKRVVIASYGSELTKGWSASARDMISANGMEAFGVTAWDRAKATEWFPLDSLGGKLGGNFYAVGKGGTLTGRGADDLIIDDLFKDMAEANSPTLREHAWQWLTSTALTRLEPDGVCVIISTRWHHDDHIGRLEKAQENGEIEGWTFVNLPAIAGPGDPLGREEGEALWPERFPLEILDQFRREVGPHVWEALYQGHPTPTEGGLFKRSWIHLYEFGGAFVEGTVTVEGKGTASVKDLVRFATVDLAASSKAEADFTVAMVFGYHKHWRMLFVLDVFRERVEGPALVPLLQGVQSRWDLVAIFVEKIGFQLTLIQAARAVGLPIREVRPDGDKVARALPATARMESGDMRFRKGAHWLPALERELLEFPRGSHDDQVDTLSYGAKVLEDLKRLRPGGPSKGGYKRREGGGGWKIGR